MSDGPELTAGPPAERAPFGTAEILAAVAGARRVLDVGCGGGRLTVALAQAGADVTGIDTSAERLEQARDRAAVGGVELRLLKGDFNEPLAFDDASFDAVTSRLALMAASDPAATLRELRRVLEPGGRLVTVVWAPITENPWFGVPREAVAAILGEERAFFARAFGRLGGPDEAAAAHRAAGLGDVTATVVRECTVVADADAHWAALAKENGHFRRIAASLDEAEQGALSSELSARLASYQVGEHLSLPRTLVLVTARRA